QRDASDGFQVQMGAVQGDHELVASCPGGALRLPLQFPLRAGGPLPTGLTGFAGPSGFLGHPVFWAAGVPRPPGFLVFAPFIQCREELQAPTGPLVPKAHGGATPMTAEATDKVQPLQVRRRYNRLAAVRYAFRHWNNPNPRY